MGAIKRIRIGHDGTKLGASWNCEYIDIEVPSTGLHWQFDCGRWLSKTRDDSEIERELYPRDPKGEPMNEEAKASYLVQTFTSDVRNAGTDAKVCFVYTKVGSLAIISWVGNSCDVWRTWSFRGTRVENQVRFVRAGNGRMSTFGIQVCINITCFILM
jgi:hypothetical protein